MKYGVVMAFLLWGSMAIVFADDLVLTDGTILKSYSVGKAYPDALMIVYSEGARRVPFPLLPEPFRVKYHYDPVAAQKYIADQEALKQAALQSKLSNTEKKDAGTSATATNVVATLASPVVPAAVTSSAIVTTLATPIASATATPSVQPTTDTSTLSVAVMPTSTDENALAPAATPSPLFQKNSPVTSADLKGLAAMVDIAKELQVAKPLMVGVGVSRYGYYWSQEDRARANKYDSSRGNPEIWTKAVVVAKQLLQRPCTSAQSHFVELFIKASELAGTNATPEYRKVMTEIQDTTPL